MGFVKRVFGTPEPSAQPASPAPVAQESEADKQAGQEKKNKAALLARNAGDRSTALSGGQSNITSKTLLGL